MLDPRQFRLLVIRPTLERLRLWSIAAEQLLLATALTESGLAYLRQIPKGPALGVYQMEPATHADIWRSYLAFRPSLSARVWALAGGPLARERELIGNLNYATAMARLVYRRVSAPLPPPGDLDATARYWKAHYNTLLGRGTLDHFRHAVMPHWRTPAFRDNPWTGT